MHEMVVEFWLCYVVQVLERYNGEVEERNEALVYNVRRYLNIRITEWIGEERKINCLEF